LTLSLWVKAAVNSSHQGSDCKLEKTSKKSELTAQTDAINLTLNKTHYLFEKIEAKPPPSIPNQARNSQTWGKVQWMDA